MSRHFAVQHLQLGSTNLCYLSVRQAKQRKHNLGSEPHFCKWYYELAFNCESKAIKKTVPESLERSMIVSAVQWTILLPDGMQKEAHDFQWQCHAAPRNMSSCIRFIPRTECDWMARLMRENRPGFSDEAERQPTISVRVASPVVIFG